MFHSSVIPKLMQHKFEMATVLLSKCFAEVDGQTLAHVNFTAAPEGQSNSIAGKRLFFAELMLIPELQVDETAEPMCVLNVCTIDDSCYGKLVQLFASYLYC